MKKTLTFTAAAIIVATLTSASAFAEVRNPEGTWRDDQARGEEARGHHRDNDRVSVQGRISRVLRDRGGVRVELDRGRESYFIPESRLGGRDLRTGVVIHIGGVYRGGVVYVDDLGYTEDYGNYREHHGRELRGVVDRVNYHLQYLILREPDGDFIRIDMRGVDARRHGLRIDDVHSGDAIAISGDWSREGLFRAEHVDRLRR